MKNFFSSMEISSLAEKLNWERNEKQKKKSNLNENVNLKWL